MARGKRAGVRTPEPPGLIKGTGAPKPPTVAPGNAYGERQALEEQASSAPMYDDQQPSQPTGPKPPMALGDLPDAFGPSSRPQGPPIAPPGEMIDANQILEAVYQAYPSPWIRSLIDR
jgi:hypothetical protein